MFNVNKFAKAGAIAALVLGGAGAANAATVTFSALPATAVAVGPVSDWGTFTGWGTYFEDVTGTAGARKSVYLDTTSPYSAVANAWAQYDYGQTYTSLSFAWGSPDDFNTVEFLLNGTVVDSYSIDLSTDIAPAIYAKTGALATFTGVTFDAVRFASENGLSFEYSNVSPVPVPAAGLLLVGALGGLAALRRRKAA